MRLSFLVVLVVTLLAPHAAAQVARHTEAEACRPFKSPVTAAQWLERARAGMGMARAAGRVLHFHAVEGEEQDYESDRTYPPYFSGFTGLDGWMDPASGVERYARRLTFPTVDRLQRPVIMETESAAYLARDTGLVAAPTARAAALARRGLDPWAVVTDWSADSTVRIAGRCRYRDYERVVLARRGPFGPERLFLSSSGLPVKLDRMEPHYLWGQRHVEYLYSVWIMADGAIYPGSSIRLVDGGVNLTRTVGTFSLITPDSAPPMSRPAGGPMEMLLPGFLQAIPPDTIRAGTGVFVLRNQGYGEVAALARDTVFLFDATQSDDRAREDSTWIARLFPGPHPVVLVVTDLAWPHVSGVRFWVASGATVVSHRASRAFLEQVVARRWTLHPDKLERARAAGQTIRLRFRPVADSLSLAGGDIGIYPIDGISSEGALIAYVRQARFLWGSDFVQTVEQPSAYALEVWRAVARAGLEPRSLAAEHLPLTSWEKVDRLVSGLDAEGPPR